MILTLVYVNRVFIKTFLLCGLEIRPHFLERAMQRNYQSFGFSLCNKEELVKQTAFHEAGHSASIYLGNKQKQLPPVFFQIEISQSKGNNQQQYAKVVDGRLIENFPGIEYFKIKNLTKQDQWNVKKAYEADVINLLVGPLAEAKYVSIRDDEALNFNLLNTQALSYYGGASDVEKAYSYIEYFVCSEQQREEQMLELFFQAFLFVENAQNWKRIMNLAEYFLNSEKEVISCEEAIEVLDK